MRPPVTMREPSFVKEYPRCSRPEYSVLRSTLMVRAADPFRSFLTCRRLYTASRLSAILIDDACSTDRSCTLVIARLTFIPGLNGPGNGNQPSTAPVEGSFIWNCGSLLAFGQLK